MSKGRPKALDYVAPSIALIASVVAVIGSPKWDDKASGLHKLTDLGWTTLIVGVLAFIATCIVTAKNNRERFQEKKTRDKIASKGKDHLLSALHHITCHLMSDYIFGRGDLQTRSAKDMLTTERHLKLGGLDINSVSPFAAGDFKDIKWYRMLEDSARDGSAEMITALQIFVTYLPADIIDTATKILECEFVKMYLFHLHDLVDANTHVDPKRVVPMFMFFSKEKSMNERGYWEFWNLCIKLEEQCKAPS